MIACAGDAAHAAGAEDEEGKSVDTEESAAAGLGFEHVSVCFVSVPNWIMLTR